MAEHSFTFAIIGIDHRHIYEMTGGMIAAGGRCKGWWSEGDPEPLAGFQKRFPELERVTHRQSLIEDPEVDLILTAARFDQRAVIAIEAMRNGKDVMTDKPGCTTADDLATLRRTAAETGRIWSVNFSERFQVAAAQQALDLVQQGAIGRVLQTVGLGPHRMNAPLRPDWFFDKAVYGGILCDIASHQIDQFLVFTGSTDAEIVAATAGNMANPDYPQFEDFGEVLLRSDRGHGYIRVDWFTPDGLPTWGDGRLTILGTEGYIELRKYVDIAGRPGKDHLFLVNGSSCEHIDCSGVKLRYFDRLAADLRDRTETAMPQEHAFKVTELALEAQKIARPAAG
ncbi:MULTISPECIES: Gfo/Idh/MocA family protein [Chelativorans]|uniref:Oxidoreductase-like protein n=1 Tax=Chelativorans sp. (strain BNC1) TaxID=266779 RepID=Q11AQ6_CHESB|nr:MULTISPECIES: Gfo/Idh/MocA family oxidoreductase [Chelativorans]